MKTLTLKENQTLYEIVAQQQQVDEPIVLEQGGRRIAVLLPLEEWTRNWARVEAEMKAAEVRDWLKTESELPDYGS